jgi:hypothetical protein
MFANSQPMPGIAKHYYDFPDLMFCKINKNKTLLQNFKMSLAKLANTETMDHICTNLQFIICIHPVCFLLTHYYYSPSYTGAKDQYLTQGEIFDEQQDKSFLFEEVVK